MARRSGFAWPALVLSALSSVALACSSLPEYAAPKGQVMSGEEGMPTDVIPYRQLSREDFHGTHAPAAFAKVADRVGAATCAVIRSSPETQVHFTETRYTNGESEVNAWVEGLYFVATMDRACSWWNDRLAAQAPAYVLEHEQIHFALFELGARRLNASLDELKTELRFHGSNQDEVKSEAREALQRTLQNALTQILERNRQFDQETSLGYKPVRQREWLQLVNQELAETAAYAR